MGAFILPAPATGHDPFLAKYVYFVSSQSLIFNAMLYPSILQPGHHDASCNLIVRQVLLLLISLLLTNIGTTYSVSFLSPP